MSGMCRTMPSSDRFEGGTDASVSCSPVSPAHFHSSVERCQSRKPSRMPLSGPVNGSSIRATSGAIQLTTSCSWIAAPLANRSQPLPPRGDPRPAFSARRCPFVIPAPWKVIVLPPSSGSLPAPRPASGSVWDEDAFEAADVHWDSQQGRWWRDGRAVTRVAGPEDWLSTLSEVSAQRLVAASQMIRRSYPGSSIPGDWSCPDNGA